MPSPAPRRPRLQRLALGLWFLGLGALGLLRWVMRAARHGDAGNDAVAWIWLIGSALLCVVGVWALARALRADRNERID
jgi:hypothetical protein